MCAAGFPACTHGCPRDSDPERALAEASRLRVSTVECAERLAEEVCSWDAAKHEERKRTAERVAQSKRRGELLHVYEPLCGCAAEPIGNCFLVGSQVPFDSTYFVVATGAPGCEHASYSGKPDEVDPSRCGSHAITRPSKTVASGIR